MPLKPLQTSGCASPGRRPHVQVNCEPQGAARLPTIADLRWPAIEPYPLMCSGPVFGAMMQQAASNVVQILKNGTKPGDLPIQQPAKFEMIVNLKTARAISLTIPQSVHLQATEVTK